MKIIVGCIFALLVASLGLLRYYLDINILQKKSHYYKIIERKNMKKVIIYTKEICPYCVKAKKLLDKKLVSYEEIDITGQDDMRENLIALSGGRKTVPQIFIGDYHIGGCDDLYALENAGKLDEILAD